MHVVCLSLFPSAAIYFSPYTSDEIRKGNKKGGGRLGLIEKKSDGFALLLLRQFGGFFPASLLAS